MSRFVFNLQSLYEYRQRTEELSQRAFADVNLRLQAEERRLAQLKQLYIDTGREMDVLKEKGVSTHELELHHSYLTGLKRQIASQEAAVIELQKHLEKKRTELVEAARNKKVIEIMKERSLSAHALKENRREQKEADDLTSARLRRKGNED